MLDLERSYLSVTSGNSEANAECLEVFLVSRDDAVEDLA